MAALLAAAMALRIAVADRDLWFDELITVLKAGEPLPELLEGLADDVHPPLYYVLLHGWVAQFGDGELAVRGLSMLWSLVAVVATWLWSREAFPRATALGPAALAAFAPFSVWYATEARMYAQLLALTALAGWLAWRILGRGPRPLPVAGLLVVLVALAYTHYFALLFVVALGVVGVAIAAGRPAARAAGAWVAATCVAAIAALAPWAVFVLEHRSASSPSPTVYPVPDVFSVVIVGLEMLIGFQSFDTLGLLAAGWPLLGLAPILLLPRIGQATWRGAGVLALLALPAGFLVAVSVAGPRSVFDPRFLAVCVVPLYLLLGHLLPRRATRPMLLAGAAVIAAASATAVMQNHNPDNPKLYEFDKAVTTVNARANAGDAILLLPNFEAAGHAGDPLFDYYRPKPGLRIADTREVGQVSREQTRAALATTWERLRRQRPERVFVIDAFGDNRLAKRAGAAARDLLERHAVPLRTVRHAGATVRVYRPRWEQPV
jgi:mannosyltransferase